MEESNKQTNSNVWKATRQRNKTKSSAVTTCEITTLKLGADRIWRSKRVDFTLPVSVKAEDAAVVERGEGVASWMAE